jgi:leucyl aminopeptidase
VDELQSDCAAVAFARDLGNTPSNIKSPRWLAERIAREFDGSDVRVDVLGPDALQRPRWGGLLSVAEGSVRPPRVVTLSLGGADGAPVVALVGKGVTFDSGGLSLKSPEAMTTMKTDMAGAAAVAGAVKALATGAGRADPGSPVEMPTVVAVLPLAENMPSGSAYRPGDVVTQFDATTTETLNTDAEGRLLLADALSYAVRRWRPQAVVDVATLTGAATLALSRHLGAIFANDDAVADGLVAAAARCGEPLWRMPLAREYADRLDSDIADVRQVVPQGSGGPGAIAAALFLSRFVGDTPWAHLDIAGPARADKASGVLTPGATGFGVRALTSWLRGFGGLVE